MGPLRVFIGHDPREAVCWHVCAESILNTAKEPGNISFQAVTGEVRDGNNTFIYDRFTIPHKCGYRGFALFLDGDMVVRSPIEDLFQMAHAAHVAVSVVKHDYKTKHPVKYLGNKNEDYPRKNWSSVMLWDCGHVNNQILTPEFVATKTGSYLHRFGWLSDHQIGDLPTGWNRLVLEQGVEPDDKLLHYTIGTPCFQEYADCDMAEEWHAAYRRATTPCRG